MKAFVRGALALALVCVCLWGVPGGAAWAIQAEPMSTDEASLEESGAGSNVLPTLESASVREGATGVPLDVVILLSFNKNVCNVAVLSNNKNCFHLTGAGGEVVPIRVIFPDEQLIPAYKQWVFVQPVVPLAANASYRLAVDSTLMAKNGTPLDDAHVIHFTTGSAATGKETAALDRLEDNIVVYESALAETAASVPRGKVYTAATAAPSGAIAAATSETPVDTGSLSAVIVVSIVALLAAATGIILLRRRKKAASK